MEQITVKLPDDTAALLEDVASQFDGNRSKAVRRLLEKGDEYDDRITELEQEYNQCITELRE